MLLSEPVGPLDYTIPEHLRDHVGVGTPVLVPLRGRVTRGYVSAILTQPADLGVALKPIVDVDPDRPALGADVMELVEFAADYYVATPGDVLASALPAAARPSARRYYLTESGRYALADQLGAADRQLLQWAQARSKGFTLAALLRDVAWPRREAATRLRRATDKGWLSIKRPGRGPRKLAAFRRGSGDPNELLSPRQRATLQVWEAIPPGEVVSASVLARSFTGAYKKLKTLEEKGLVERVEVTQRLRVAHEPTLNEAPVTTLTSDQQQVLQRLQQALQERAFGPFLLQGVTGSGKTEVYLRLIEAALARGMSALVLVPEIALTPQLGARFRARFGGRIATFHSGLSVAERRDEWERVSAGEVSIGLGARSALFLPLKNLGVIIVDEEHETSYKQEETPRYHARDLAVVRGRRCGATVVLGSATPSLETRHNASLQRYERLVMPVRVAGRPLPQVEMIDLTHASRVGDGILSEPLSDALKSTLARGEQAILFLNRRGFAPFVYCRDCGAPFRCPDCDVGLTLHRKKDRLLCHYCAFEMIIPEVCPGCHSLNLEAHGLGTERLEAELKQVLGSVALARLDRDTIRNRADLDRELTRFRQGEARVMIGTQMVTKGHDFPGVTLVGIVAADASLNFPDFRAAERTFQLLTQVAGRAGRGELRGQVLVQAYEVDHYALKAAVQHDYEGFAAHELETRDELFYPPFARLVLIRYEGPDEIQTRAIADEQAAALREVASNLGVHVLGPAAAPLARLRGQWRFHILLKAERRTELWQTIAALPRRTPGEIRRVIDVDPVNML